MFNEFHGLDNTNNIILSFIKSSTIQVYPCGRRRSSKIDSDGNTDTVSDQFYIPFDPEARLNTEFNNRKLSGTNGFTDTYIKEWSNTKLSLVLAGYSFEINFGTSFEEFKLTDVINMFITELLDGISSYSNIMLEDVTALYANIRLEEIPLYIDKLLDYNTWVLRNQSDSSHALPDLDLLVSKKYTDDGTDKNIDVTDIDNYYFSGISFTTSPLSGKIATRSELDMLSGTTVIEAIPRKQKIISLRILDKISNTAKNGTISTEWVIHQAAYLPKIEHGDTENSVILQDANIKVLTAESMQLVNTSETSEPVIIGEIPVIRVVSVGPAYLNNYQLQIFFGNTLPKEPEEEEILPFTLGDEIQGELGKENVVLGEVIEE